MAVKAAKKSYRAKTYRVRRRSGEVLGDLFRAVCLLLSVFVLTCSFIYVYSCLLSSPYFEIRETSVRGLKELTEKDILTLAQIKTAGNLLAVNKTAIKKNIKLNPWVKNIYIGRELPGRLVIALQERQPLALVEKGGDFYLVDVEGFLFKKLSDDDYVDLPVITGFEEGNKTKEPLFLSAINLVKLLEGSRSYAYLGILSEVNIDSHYGLSVLTEKGMYLRLGTGDYESKLKSLKIVMADLEKKGMTRGYLSIDLADASKITVQRRDGVARVQGDARGKRYRM